MGHGTLEVTLPAMRCPYLLCLAATVIVSHGSANCLRRRPCPRQPLIEPQQLLPRLLNFAFRAFKAHGSDTLAIDRMIKPSLLDSRGQVISSGASIEAGCYPALP